MFWFVAGFFAGFLLAWGLCRAASKEAPKPDAEKET